MRDINEVKDWVLEMLQQPERYLKISTKNMQGDLEE
jgi:hypothetical protein